MTPALNHFFVVSFIRASPKPVHSQHPDEGHSLPIEQQHASAQDSGPIREAQQRAFPKELSSGEETRRGVGRNRWRIFFQG